jgi:hypothetical protein
MEEFWKYFWQFGFPALCVAVTGISTKIYDKKKYSNGALTTEKNKNWRLRNRIKEQKSENKIQESKIKELEFCNNECKLRVSELELKLILKEYSHGKQIT